MDSKQDTTYVKIATKSQKNRINYTLYAYAGFASANQKSNISMLLINGVWLE
jgi:hypothetical protein